MRKKQIKFTPLDAVIIGMGILCVGLFIWRVEATMDYKWRWNVLVQYLLRFDADAGRWVPGLVTEGLLTTIRLAAWTMVFATLLGMIMGLARTAKGLFPRMVGRTYVELIRNTPPLVLIFIFYFFLADHLMTALGVDDFIRSSPLWFQNLLPHVAAPVPRISNFLAALLTMAVYEGAFITEHVRAGIQSIERGQHEAAYALGLTRWQQMRHVVLPQAFSRIVPPLAGQFISTIKDTAIVSVISVQELTFQGLELMAATYMTFEIMITVTVLYLMLTLTCSALARKLELRLRNNL